MATAESIPTIDLRPLSHSDLQTLALSSSSTFNLDTLSDVTPIIDRSVFNESAASRKQTFSRLPLSSQNPNPNEPPPQPHSQSQPRRRGRPRVHPSPNPNPNPSLNPNLKPAADDAGRQENLKIVSIIKKLFEARDKGGKLNEDVDKEVRNEKGEVVDLAALAGKEDLFEAEIRRRTEGLRTEEQLLGYMTGIDGQWGSRRKKRKVVDAAVFGEGALPKGWKVLMGLKRKDGIVYLNCQRYVSPSGKHFMSCKEVSAYILSLNGQQDALQSISAQHDDGTSRTAKLTTGSVAALVHQVANSNEMTNCSFVAPISYVSAECEKQGRLFMVAKHGVAEPDNSLECKKCNLTFVDRDAHSQHLLTFHQSTKRRRLGKSITDGVIVKDGKYGCQFCHKTFTERHRYNGHIGAHRRYDGLGVDASANNNCTRIDSNQPFLAVVPHVPSEINISDNKSAEAYATKSSLNQEDIHSPQCLSDANMIEIEHNPEEGTLEIAEVVTSDCKKEIEHNHKEGKPELDQGVPSSRPVDNQGEDCNITCSESKDISKAADATNITSNASMDDTSPCKTDVNNVSHACSPIPTEEPSTSKSVHDQIDDCAMTSDYSGVIEDSNAQGGESTVCADAIFPMIAVDGTTFKTISETGDHNMVAFKFENDVNNSIAMSTEITNNTGHLTSIDNSFGEQINDCDVPGYRSEVVNTADVMNTEANDCVDASPSPINFDNISDENHISVDPISCTVISSNGDQKVCKEHQLLSLSGNDQSYGIETYASNVFTPTDLDTSMHDKSDNRDIGIASAMHNELNNSCLFTDIGNEPTSGIETNADCMFPGDLNKSLFDGFDGVGNELQDYFSKSNACNEDATDVMMNDGDGRHSLQFNVADQCHQSSPWMQSSNSLPILDLIPNQCHDELQATVQRNEQADLSGFEELRLGSIYPSDFVLFTGQASGSATTMDLFPDDHLDWGMSLTKMSTPSVPTSVCVWCNREFSLEGIESEPHSGSLGYICPDCKSGQFAMLNNGYS